MSKTGDRALTIVDAARLLYRTDAPTDQQIGRIYERMKSGAIRVQSARGSPHDWTTTEKALADFVAGEMLKRRPLQPATRPVQPLPAVLSRKPNREQVRDTRELQDVYHNIWRDAFLAVLLRRRIAHRSVTFHRGVLVCQILLLLATLGTIAGVASMATLAVAPAEHAPVHRWLESNTDTYQIVRWHPPVPNPDGGGTLIEVEYRYTLESRRPITTRRTFQVLDDEAHEHSAEE